MILVRCDDLDALETLLIVVSARDIISGSFERVLLLLGVFGVILFELSGELRGDEIGESWFVVDFRFVLSEFLPVSIVFDDPALVPVLANMPPNSFEAFGLRSRAVTTSKLLLEVLTLGEVGSAGRNDVRLFRMFAASSTSAVINLSKNARRGLFCILLSINKSNYPVHISP